MDLNKGYDKVFTIISSIYIVFLTFGLSIVNIALIALILLYIIDFKKTKSLMIAKLKQHKTIYLLFLASALFQIIIAFFANDLGDRRIGYLGLQLFAIIILLRTENIKVILNTFLISLVCLVLVGSFNLLNYYLSTGEFNMKGGGHINKLLVVARPYLGFLLSIGTFVSLYLFKEIKAKYRAIYILLPVFFIIYLGVISNRIQILSLLLITILYFVFYLRVSILKKVTAISSMIVVLAIALQFNSNLKERFGLSGISKDNLSLIDRLSHIEPRVTIWKCTFGIIREDSFNHLKGIGNMEVLLSKLGVCYDVSTIDNPMRGYFLSDLFNTHNQFLEYYVLSGLIGFLILASVFIVLFRNVKNQFIPTAMLVTLFNFCFVDNLFDRQIGSYFFGFTIFLILLIYTNKKKQLNFHK